MKWIIYLPADIWCFAAIVRMLDRPSLCRYLMSVFKRLQVLSLDIWPSTALCHFLAQRTIAGQATEDDHHAQRPNVRVLVRVLVTISCWSFQTESDDNLMRRLTTAVTVARQSYSSTVVRIPPQLREIRIKTNMLPLEFETLQSQIFQEPGAGRCFSRRPHLIGQGSSCYSGLSNLTCTP